MTKIRFVTFLACVITAQASAQVKNPVSKTDINAGYSRGDLVNVGIKYRFNQSQVGVNFGVFNSDRDVQQSNFFLTSVSLYNHLLGTSKYTTLRPWFVKTTLTYKHHAYTVQDPWNSELHTDQKDLLVRFHAGRDFNFSPRFGLTVSAGFGHILYSDYKLSFFARRKTLYELKLYGMADASFYYRLNSSSDPVAKDRTALDNLEIYGGTGLPEGLLYAGIKYRIRQTQIGISRGSYLGPGTPETTRMFVGTATISQHVWGKSDLTSLKPWFIKHGYTLWYQKDVSYYTEIDKYIYSFLQLGRDFNITKHFGINLSLGAGATVYSKHQIIAMYNRTDESTEMWQIFPSGDLSFYLRTAP